MSSRTSISILTLALLAGPACKRNEPKPAPAAPPVAAALAAPAAPSAAPATPPAAMAPAAAAIAAGPKYRAAKPGSHNVDGLKVEFRKDGSVGVSGKDRWGQKLELTYESATFFKRAIPVISRSVTPGQGAGLDKVGGDLVEEPAAAKP